MTRYCLRSAFAAAAVLLFLLPDGAGAVGLGIYGEVSRGDASDWWSEEFSTRHREVGFVLDTSVAGRRAFSYRLQIGHDRLDADSDEGRELGSDATLEGLVLDHTFAFRLFQQEPVRLWLGPQLRFAWYKGHGNYPDGFGGKERTDIELRAFGVGPIMGLNLNVPGGPTLSLSGGWRIVFYGGDEDAQPGATQGGDYDGFTEGQWFLDLGLLLRLGE